MGINQFDQLVVACRRDAESWPINLVHKQQLKCELRRHQDHLLQDAGRLFVSGTASLEVVETRVGESSPVAYVEMVFKNVQELAEHLDRHLTYREQEPRTRHVFLSADHSRAALRCTPQMFRYLCSYQQISPIILQMLASFGKQGDPLDYYSALFSHDDLARPVSGSSQDVREIGRSNWELRHCYKLNGIEISDVQPLKWTMRQTAVYHSFDMENGRSFWFTVKGNDEIRDRMKDGSESIEHMRPSNQTDLKSSLIGCLHTHMITLDWCAEGWRQHVGETEKEIRKVLDRASKLTIQPPEDMVEYTRMLIRQASTPPLKEGGPAGLGRFAGTPNTQSGSLRGSASWPVRMASKVLASAEPAIELTKKTPQSTSTAQTLQSGEEVQIRLSKYMDRLKTFSLTELQDLYIATKKLQEVRLAMNLNIGVLQHLREYYRDLLESRQLPKHVRNAPELVGEMHWFIQRIKSIEKQLEAECSRTDTLTASIQDGKQLYDSVLQYYNMEISKQFTQTGVESSKKMEDVTAEMHEIAKKTARDSSSMNVVTFLTLVFLPGTFLGVRLMLTWLLAPPSTDSLTLHDQTFFSTPMINNGEQTWSINNSLLWLFLEICIPMMVVVIVLWLFYMRRSLRRQRAASDGSMGSDSMC